MAPKLLPAKTEDREHAEYSASGSHRWLNCPGSHELSKRVPPLPESPYAAEGTLAHECLEFILKNCIRNPKNLGRATSMAAGKYSEEMVSHAHDAAVYILDRAAEHPGAEILCETRVDASPFTCADQFGTLDAAIVEVYGRLIVIDYKYGAGIPVDPEGDGGGNSQLVYYALGISHVYQHDFTEVELVVIQPRAFHVSGNQVRSHVMTMEQLRAWEPRFRNGVMETNNPKAKLAAGAWCKFCAAKPACPEIGKEALRRAQATFSEAGKLEAPPPAELEPKALSQALKACVQLETWIEGVREYALAQLEAGKKIDGFKLVRKRAQRKWKDEKAAAKKAKALFGPLAFSAPELLTPAQIEKAAKDSPKLDGFLSQHVTEESSGVTIASEADKRPAVNLAKNVFTKAVGSGKKKSSKTTKGK